jgi:hypothetical protein
MTNLERQLHDALAMLMQVSPDLTGDERRARTGEALRLITALHAQLPANADPMLRHYLDQRSYQKAYNLLRTGTAESAKPQCDH